MKVKNKTGFRGFLPPLLLVPLVAAVVGALLLLLVSCIPQTMIYDHTLESAE